MLMLKVALIESVGIIATIITTVIFAVVLGFQIRATNAATKAANAAAAQTERLRPHVVFGIPVAVDLSAHREAIRWTVENVGFTPAFGVNVVVELFDSAGDEISEGAEDHISSTQDLPPRHVMPVSVGEGADALRERVVNQEAGLELQMTVRYSLSEDDRQSHSSRVRYQIYYVAHMAAFRVLDGKFDRPIPESLA